MISVHSVISLDFAIGNTPGYHSTIFPPYFVAGALFSGFAMVLTLAIPLRRAFDLQDIITMRHLENAAKVHARDGLPGRLLVRDGDLHGLLQRRPLRDRDHGAALDRPVRAGLLDHARLQRRSRRSCSGGAGLRTQHRRAVRAQHRRQPRHVDGARADRRLEPGHRLRALGLGPLHPDGSGTGSSCSARSAPSSGCSSRFVRVLPAISISEMRELVRETAKGKA